MNRSFLGLVLLSVLASSFTLDLVDPGEAGLVLYFGSGESQYYALQDAASLPDHPEFIYATTHLYIHGFGENLQNESVTTIVNAYLFSGRQINIVCVDYSKFVSKDYISAVQNTINLAPVLAERLLQWIPGKLASSTLTVVGHSLGGEFAGMLGRQIKSLSGNSISLPKLIILDPASPAFFPQDLLPQYKTVGKDDADFVCIIHTGAPNYSLLVPTGHVDFYPNGGGQCQPDCTCGPVVPFSKQDLCNHQMSWRYWGYDTKHVDGVKFWAFPATDYVSFRLIVTTIPESQAIIMGHDCPTTVRGTYFLDTNPAPTYPKGMNY